MCDWVTHASWGGVWSISKRGKKWLPGRQTGTKKGCGIQTSESLLGALDQKEQTEGKNRKSHSVIFALWLPYSTLECISNNI